jgi:3-dehydroquinate dehydratase II
MRVLVLHGPNLNLLGKREPEVYGTLNLDEVNERIAEHAKSVGVAVEMEQSNSEGDLVDLIQQAPNRADALVINAGGYSHTSVAIRDAIVGVGLPAIAVHISNPQARETFRHTDFVAGACRGVVAGFGWQSYTTAIDLLAANSA